LSELVIGVSNVVSPLCYSVIRVEPFSKCSLNCVYCFGRWYWREGVLRPNFRVIRGFSNLVKSVINSGSKALPARLATLSEPFQDTELSLKLSLKVLKLSLEYGYPLIINTKSVNYVEDPWRRVIEELCSEGLVVIQASIPSLNEVVTKYLEPKAPTVKERLEALKVLSDVCDALVVRLSPYIPRLSTYPSINELVSTLREVGVKHVITESLRIGTVEVSNYSWLLRKFGLSMEDLEPYSLVSESVLRFNLRTRLNEYRELSRELLKEGITFATCKEGLFELHTAPNCCGIHLLRSEVVGVRPTLKELYDYVVRFGRLSIDVIDDVLYNEICRREGMLCRDDFINYPKEVRKLLKYHERKLLKVVKNPEVLSKVAPNLSIVSNYLVTNDLLTS